MLVFHGLGVGRREIKIERERERDYIMSIKG